MPVFYGICGLVGHVTKEHGDESGGARFGFHILLLPPKSPDDDILGHRVRLVPRNNGKDKETLREGLRGVEDQQRRSNQYRGLNQVDFENDLESKISLY
uniref:Uncharacterized protein n=1 Tax=Oryza brachyantha TaxID=4533 RepID=J3MWJ7_ORYBR